MSRARYYCLTSFGAEKPACEKCSYLLATADTCPETGKHHWHIYVEFPEGVTMNTVKRRFKDESLHVEAVRSKTAYIKYIKGKSPPGEQIWWEEGTPAHQGQRSDLQELGAQIMDGARFVDLAEDPANLGNLIRYSRGLQWVAALRDQKLSMDMRKLDVHVYWGISGAGKTWSAIQAAGNSRWYKISFTKGGSIWWDGYDGEEWLIIDEFGQEQVPVETLLTWLDVYSVRLPVKGGHVPAKWTHVFITSNIPWEAWYPEGPSDRLRRRIHEVRHFEEIYTEVVCNTETTSGVHKVA